MRFTLRTALVLFGATLAAALVSPLAAAVLVRFGLPFSRIFDRTVMVASAAGLVWQARRLKLWTRLSKGFARPAMNILQVLRGLAVSLACIVGLLIIAWKGSGQSLQGFGNALGRMPRNLLAALLIATLEEGFFRAFLLDGMAEDFGPRPALIVSAAVYAMAHVTRSPARFALRGLHPLAGFDTLATYLGRLRHPFEALPASFGLFLLGLVLGEAFLVVGGVYLAVGLHAGFVLGVKSWRFVAPRSTPTWLGGFGGPALIGGPAAWLLALALLVLIRPIAGRRANSAPVAS